MTVQEFLNILKSNAKEYSIIAKTSIGINRHMNELREGELINQEHIDAVLAGYINFIGMKRGVDLALYAKDLKDDTI